MDKNFPEIALYVTSTHEHGFFHIYAHPVVIGTERPDSVRNVNDHTQVKGKLFLDDLRVYSQANDDRDRPTSDRKLYGFELQYTQSRVTLREVTRMAKTLTKLEKALDKLNATRGYVGSFGEYVARVAEVIGAKRMVFQVKENGNRGWSYDDAQHWFNDLGDGRARIDRMETQWRESFAPTVEPQ